MFAHFPASRRILVVSGAGLALAAALAAAPRDITAVFDKADVASSGAAPAERAPEPAGVAGPQDVAKVAEQVKPAVIAVIAHVVEDAVAAPPRDRARRRQDLQGKGGGSLDHLVLHCCELDNVVGSPTTA